MSDAESFETLPSPAVLAISTKQLHALTIASAIAFVDIGLGPKRPTRRYRMEGLEAFVVAAG